uniref:alpha/beta fold hydrolase n=1 Tax=uncultured Sphingomonas sp. TaxID=158754 RepID=UPI0035CBECFE
MPEIAQPRSCFIQVGESRLHYVSHGDPTAPTLLLVHGMRDHARSWDWIAAAFAERFHVIAVDLRGHGDSSWARPAAYGLAAFVLDLAILIDALALQQIALIGHSLGGAIALRYAAAFPDRVKSMVVIEGIELPIIRDERAAPIPFPNRMRTWIKAEGERRGREARGYATIADAERRMVEAQPDIDCKTVAYLAEHGVIRAADGLWRWKYDNAIRLRAPDDPDGCDLDQTLAAIACPTLLAYGEASWIPLPPPERLALICDHRIVRFPDASHWLHHQARAAFIAAVRTFLNISTKGPDHA